MKKELFHFIKKIISFLVFAFTVYVLLICLLGEMGMTPFLKNLNYPIGVHGFLFSRLQEVKTTHDVDILFLGSSHTYRGFDNRIFKKHGFSSFNLGSSNQTPLQTEVLIQRYLHSLRPKHIIYEVHPEAFTMDGVESTLHIISNDKNDFASLKMAFIENHIKVYNVLIYAFYRDFFNRNSNFTEEKIIGDDQYISGGFVEKKLHYFEHKIYPKKQNIYIPTQWEAFDRTVHFIQKNNIQLTFVQAPVTSALYQSYTDNTDFDKKIMSYGTYYNFNEIMQLDDSLHFFDADHLNQNGVEIFNEKLLRTASGF
ncbi:MAG TPA: hypothetical protein ENJ53_09710 [Phaeodactylibacter sp.]|nr:hypothetical protein [Phaeodactylibacter sp.]